MRKTNSYKTDDVRWLEDCVYTHVMRERTNRQDAYKARKTDMDFSAMKCYG